MPLELTRRDALKTTASAMAIGLAQMSMPGFVFPGENDEEEVVPFAKQPRARPGLLDWEGLTDWITPADQIFSVSHYGPAQVAAESYKLDIGGLVETPKTLSLDEIKALPQKEQLMTLECSGNGASPGFMSAIFNAKFTGTSLADMLKACGIKPGAKEIVFFGADAKEEEFKKEKFRSPFARSMTIEDALNPNVLLVYHQNGQPLPQNNGFPLRLLVPGWYGIANVKWVQRIEVWDRRYMGRFMAYDYVTLRGKKSGEQVEFTQTSVTKMNLKSIVARVMRRPTVDGQIPVKVHGAVWGDGSDIKSVEVQVDGGEWQPAKIDAEPRSKFCWAFFSLDLGKLAPGTHTIVSRATDATGRVQPAATDDEIALKKTYYESYQQWPREVELKA